MHAPYTHSLPLLAGKLSIQMPEEIQEAVVRFMEFYFEARYPEDQNKFYKKCTEGFTEQNLGEIKKVFKWFKEKLEK